MERWIVQRPDKSYLRYEGFIELHPAFKGWAGRGKKLREQAYMLLDGKLCIALKQRATLSESRRCSPQCKKAHPLTPCFCVCGGENHGKEYDGVDVPTEDSEIGA